MRKYIQYTAVILMAVLLSSCQAAKYKTPNLDTSELYRDVNKNDTTTIADIKWREYFNDPFLQNLVQEGLASNIDLKVAVTKIRQAEQGLKIARAAYFPTLAGVAQTTYHSNGDNASGWNHTLGVSASWELDIWGKLSSQKRSSIANFMATEAYKDLIQTSLIANIADTYYSLIALDEQLKISNETIELLTETVETMTALKEQGMLNGAAVEQSKSLLYSTQVSIPDLERSIRSMENAICFMLGKESGRIERGVLTTQVVPSELSYGVPAQMIAKRPDVRQAELNFRSAFEMTKAARASLYPSLAINTGSLAGYGSNVFENFFKFDNFFSNIVGGLTQPIFAGKKLRGQLEIAKAQQEEALLGFKKTVLNAGMEVSNTLYNYQSALKKDRFREQQVEALNTSVYFTKELLRAGDANYIEVLTAEQNLLSSRLGQVQDRLQQLSATVELYRVLGGGTE